MLMSSLRQIKHQRWTRFSSNLSRGLLIGAFLMFYLLAVSVSAQTSRVKRISLMTPNLDQTIAFFTEVIGFKLDFEGTLPPGG